MISYVVLEVAQIVFTTFVTACFGRGPRVAPAGSFPELAVLEERWEAIRDECERALARLEAPTVQDVERSQRRLNRDSGWRILLLSLYGRPVAEYEEVLPETAAALRGLPGVVTAFFSVLEPGKRIPLHPGHNKGLWRVHLPVVVPEGDCAIEIGGEVTRWEPGHLLVFDDTYWHRVWNLTDGRRVVLFMDLVRPLPWRWLDRVNRAIIAGLGRSARTVGATRRAAEHARELRATPARP